MPLQLGEVRAAFGSSARVLAFDELEVLYQSWPPGGSQSAQGDSQTFFRVALPIFEQWPRVDLRPLEPDEIEVVRPDLPLRTCRHPTLNWRSLASPSVEALEAMLLGAGIDTDAWQAVAAPRVSLVAFGPIEGMPMRRATVAATHDRVVSSIELLWGAQRLFASQGIEADAGIGLYRSGTHEGAPEYFLWGYHDGGGATWLHEEKRDIKLKPEWRLRRKPASGSYEQRLASLRQAFPFEAWREGGEAAGLDQYSEENCAALTATFERLLHRLTALGEGAPESSKLEAFREAIEATNELNEQEGMMLIETGEAGQICELCNEIARAAGLDPKRYGGGEGPASEWREW